MTGRIYYFTLPPERALPRRGFGLPGRRRPGRKRRHGDDVRSVRRPGARRIVGPWGRASADAEQVEGRNALMGSLGPLKLFFWILFFPLVVVDFFRDRFGGASE